MKKYQKIPSLYKFNSATNKFTDTYCNPIVGYIADCNWVASEKINGMNVRVEWDGYKFRFSGRTDDAVLPVEVHKLLSEVFNYNMELTFEQHFGLKPVMLYLEAYGGKIQNGTYNHEERLIGLDVEINNIYLDRVQASNIFTETVKIPFVKTIVCPDLHYVIKLAETHEMGEVEGIVAYPMQRIYDHMGNRIIVKIKKRDLQNME